MRNKFIATYLNIAISTLAFGVAHAQSTEVNSVNLLSAMEIKTGTVFDKTEFGGISGLDMAKDGTYWAISDDRGGAKGTPRFYNIKIDFDQNTIKGVTFNKVRNMKTPNGTNFPKDSKTVDPEAIRVAPNGNLYWASEGNWDQDAAKRYQPFVREMKTDGTHVRELNIPPSYNYYDNLKSGVRNNNSFEALAVTPDGSVYVATEGGLYQDGGPASLDKGSKIRVTKLNPTTNAPEAQYVYELPKIPTASPTGGFADNGLTELLAISNNEFLALERSYADGVGNTIRIVKATITGDSTNVRNINALEGASYKPMKREVLLEMAGQYRGVKMDNMEAMSWGKALPNGNRSLIVVSDNNFSDKQRTLFMVFEVK